MDVAVHISIKSFNTFPLLLCVCDINCLEMSNTHFSSCTYFTDYFQQLCCPEKKPQNKTKQTNKNLLNRPFVTIYPVSIFFTNMFLTNAKVTCIRGKHVP